MRKLLVFVVVAMIAGAAMAQFGTTYGWTMMQITLAGQPFDATGWSTDPNAPTYLGTLDMVHFFRFDGMSVNLWSNTEKRSGFHLCFNTYVNGIADVVGADYWVGNLVQDPAEPKNFSLTNTSGQSMGAVILKNGDEVVFDFWARTMDGEGGPDEWYKGGAGDPLYHASFTVGAAAGAGGGGVVGDGWAGIGVAAAQDAQVIRRSWRECSGAAFGPLFLLYVGGAGRGERGRRRRLGTAAGKSL